MAERDPRYFKVYQDGEDRDLEQKVLQIIENGSTPGIDVFAREKLEEIQRAIGNGNWTEIDEGNWDENGGTS